MSFGTAVFQRQISIAGYKKRWCDIHHLRCLAAVL